MKFSYLKRIGRAKDTNLQTKYGNTSEIVNSYVEEIMNLPTVTGTRAEKIHPFYEKLVYCVQSLETLGKIQEINGYV